MTLQLLPFMDKHVTGEGGKTMWSVTAQVIHAISIHLALLKWDVVKQHYTLCLKKGCHFYFCNNFGRCRPILIILSLLYSQIYCWGRWC